MQSTAKTVDEYITSLPADRQEPIRQLIVLVRTNLPEGYEEAMEWGMPSYRVPLAVYPDTYNKRPLMYAAVASQKNHMALYVTSPDMDKSVRKQLEDGFKKAGKKLDMGASCIRFKQLEDLPLDIIADVIASTPMERHIANAKAARSTKK